MSFNQPQSNKYNHHQAEDDLLMEFVLAPDDPTGKKILRTPMRINVEDLARTGGVNVTTTDNQGRSRQTTIVVEDDSDVSSDDNGNIFSQRASASASKQAAATTTSSSSAKQQHHRAEVVAMDSQSKYNPIDARAMEQLRRESELDAVEGRRTKSSQQVTRAGGPGNQQQQHFVDGEWAHGTFVASISGRPQELDSSQNTGAGHPSQSMLLAGASVIGAGGVLVDDGRQQNIRCCAPENRRSFGPPPLRRFASCGYTNACWGGDGARRLLVAGGLSKTSVEHEVYEYSLSGQRWRRLECRAEAHTPQGLPIMPLARHSHSASILLESGQGGEPFMVIYGGVGLGGRVVPNEALESRQARQNFEELFGCDPDTFAKHQRATENTNLQVCSVLDLIAGEAGHSQHQQSSFGNHNIINQGGSHHSNSTPSRYDGFHEPASNQSTRNAGTVMAVGGHTNISNQVGVLDEVYELNLKSRSWRKVPVGGCAPPHLCEHSCVTFGNRLIIYGGTTMEMLPADGTYLHFLEARRAKNPHTSSGRSRAYEWSMRALEPAPPARARHTAVASSPDTMTIFGGIGFDGSVLGDLWMLHEVHSEEPFWTKISLCSQASAERNKHKDASTEETEADRQEKHEEDEQLAHLYGRAAHSACMSYGHRLLIVGGQSEKGVVSSVIEIQLGRAIVDGATEAICRVVKVGGDALPRYCFGSAIAAGDGVSALVFGGQKTWKEDRKKLMMLKNPTPEEIARLRRKAKDQETLTNNVFIFSYPELTGRERKKYEYKLLKQQKRATKNNNNNGSDSDSDDDDDDFSWNDDDQKKDEVPESFLKFVDKSHKSFKFMWEGVKKQQQKIENEAKLFAATKIFITREETENLYDLLNDAKGFIGEGRPEERISTNASDRDARIAAYDQAQSAIFDALNVARIRKPAGDIVLSHGNKQQLHYLAIEMQLRECQISIDKMKKIQKAWDAPPHVKQWSDEHETFLTMAQEKLTEVRDAVKKYKNAVVEQTIQRIVQAQERTKAEQELARKKAEESDREMLAKTAMEHILDERKRQNRSGSAVAGGSKKLSSGAAGGGGTASWGKPPKRSESAASSSSGKKKSAKKQNKKIATTKIPEYGEQIPELEIVVIANDRNVHSRLVRVCRHEIGTLKNKIELLPAEARSDGKYDKVFAAINQIENQVAVIEKDLPPAPDKKQQQQLQQQRPTYGLQGNNNGANKEVDESQKLKSLTIMQHSKQLIDNGKDLKEFARQAAKGSFSDDVEKKLESIKESVDGLDKVARSFRQYWHLTFLSRGYERGGASALKLQQQSSNSRPSSAAAAARGPPRCASIPTGNGQRTKSPINSNNNNNNIRAPTPTSVKNSNNRPPLSVQQGTVSSSSTTTAIKYPVQIQALPPGHRTNSANSINNNNKTIVNAHGSVNWNNAQSEQHTTSTQQTSDAGSWAIQSGVPNQQQPQSMGQHNQQQPTVPPSSQVDWLRGNDSNSQNVQIGNSSSNNINNATASMSGHAVTIVPTGQPLQLQQHQNENQQPSTATAHHHPATATTAASTKPKSNPTSRPSSSSVKQDTLFKGTSRLTPGERRILEARAKKN